MKAENSKRSKKEKWMKKEKIKKRKASKTKMVGHKCGAPNLGP
jgi:hypothetical protein